MSILCLVPSSAKGSRVARRLCDAQGGVLFGRQVATFDALAAALVAARGERRPILSTVGERLLAVEAGREAAGPFASLSPSDGLAAALHSALGELRRGEVDAGEALAAAGELAGAARERLERIARALAGWERRLEERGLLDRPGALRAAADAVRARVVLPETRDVSLLLLDGFATLSPGEWELFTALAARAGAVRVHLPHLSDLPAGTAAAEPLARKLESLHELAASRRVEVVQERADDPARLPRIAALVAAMAGGAAPPGAEGEVRAIAAAGEEDEARAIAAAAAALVEGGMPPEALAVFSPSAGADAPRLARAFAEVGLPFAAGRGLPLRDVPVVRLLREVLGAAGALGRRAAERLAASSYLSLGEAAERMPALLDRAGALDGRRAPLDALRARARALGAGGWRERARLRGAAASLGTLGELLAPMASPATGRRHAARLAAFVEGAGIQRRAARAERPLAERDLAALDRVAEAAEEVARSLAFVGRAEDSLSLAEWRALLDVALSSATVPPAGEPFGGAVALLGLDEAPGESHRGVLLVGCGRATFPAAPPPEPLLREPERQALCARLRRPAVATAAARWAEARHRALLAAASGREAVVFAWCSPDGPVSPLVAAGLAAAGVEIPAAPREPPTLPEARSPREALRAAVRDARRDGSAGAALGGPLADRLGSALARGGVEAERRAAVDAGEPSPFAGAVAPAAMAASLPAEWTPSQLEEFARCPFRAFLSLGVGLRSPEGTGVDIDPRDEGSLVHAALERFVAARIARGAWPPAGDAADRAEALEAVDAVFATFEAAGRTGDPAVWGARRRAVRARLLRWVEAEGREPSALVPHLLEHPFGEGSGRPPLHFGAGADAVAVRGRIDRVDADGRRLLVVDYKNARANAERRAALDPESFGVTSFQIPIYLAAAARDLPGREEAAATFAMLRDGDRLEPFATTVAALTAGPLAARLEAGVVGVAARARGGRFPIASRDCERCEHGAICRFQGAAEVEAAGR